METGGTTKAYTFPTAPHCFQKVGTQTTLRWCVIHTDRKGRDNTDPCVVHVNYHLTWLDFLVPIGNRWLACSNLFIWVLKLSEHRWSYYQECITRISYHWLAIAKKTTIKCWCMSLCRRALYENIFMVCSYKLDKFCEHLQTMCLWNSILFST